MFLANLNNALSHSEHRGIESDWELHNLLITKHKFVFLLILQVHICESVSIAAIPNSRQCTISCDGLTRAPRANPIKISHFKSKSTILDSSSFRVKS